MSTENEQQEQLPEPPKRFAALAGLLVMVGVAGFAIWSLAEKEGSRSMLQNREEAFQVKTAETPVKQLTAPMAPEKPPANPDDARNRELAERLLLMQQQAEIARLEKLQAEQLKQAKAEREARAKRLTADILVYSQGGVAGDTPQRDPNTVDLFAGTTTPRGEAAAPAEPTDWVPTPDATTRGGAVATQAGPMHATIFQGKMISAVLESRIESEKPGLVRAMVDEDVMSEDGSQVLVEKGTRLIGEYRSQVVRGDRRVMVIWQRLIRPDAVSIQLASPGVDELGVSGLTGDVDTRFFERFGAAILLSFVDAQVRSASDDTAIYLSDAGGSANTALRDSINIPPRIVVNQGSRISVFVARDLDFRRTDA